jgi:Amt family ammonium transporter
MRRGKPSILGTASGAIAGLVCITPASGFVQPMPALFMGLAAGSVCFLACGKIKHMLGYDDSLDAFGVHGIGGTLGALLTGVFATLDVNPAGAQGVFYGGSMNLIWAQLAAVVVTVVLSAALTFVMLKAIESVMGLRVDAETEQKGLDVTVHGEEGYSFT